jgi:quercetin dioxygenase-like cupin family protein
MPIYDVPRIRTRIVVGDGSGAESTAVWEQWISADGYIPLHYHEEEEVIVLLEGRISITLGENQDAVCGPSTIVIPAREIHGLRPVGPEEVHLLGFFPVTSPKIYAPDGALRPLPWEDRAESEAPP